MNAALFQKAVSIIARHHSSEVKINTPAGSFAGGLGESDFRLHVIKCAPAVINELLDEGYSLGMSEEGLYVDYLG